MTPQYIKINEDGNKFYYKDKEMTIYHREDGPAIEGRDGYKAWYLNGKRHREDGPAVEWACGSKYWYLNGELHREDGPAIEYASGTKEWYLNGLAFSEAKFIQKTFKYFTCIWEDRWQCGSHHHCLTKKTIVKARDIHSVMKSAIGERCCYVFEGVVLSIGENFDESLVEVIFNSNER
jgi:hypothetical protein